MIKNLGIKNFKSIKSLDFKCKKLNVLIGEPNSGKSNIIEALALRSQNAIREDLNKEIFRYNTLGDLFCDFNINTPIAISADLHETRLEYAVREDGTPQNYFNFVLNQNDEEEAKSPTQIDHEGKIKNQGFSGKTMVHLYEYKRLSAFTYSYMPHLDVPFGTNLPSLLLANSEYKRWVSEFLKVKNLKLTLKPTENDILASKIIDDEIYSFPYNSLSETLQRIIFYTIAIISNKNSVILLDEPDSNTFPMYTKNLAERIALDETNQFFITTHNPYLLLCLIEKSSQDKLNVCITQMKNFETTLTSLNEKQVTEVLDLESDVFFNFNKILDS